MNATNVDLMTRIMGVLVRILINGMHVQLKPKKKKIGG